jgi:maleylacetate reductase
MRRFEQHGGPTRIVFGAGTLSQVGEELGRLGGHRALVLSTPGHSDLAGRVAAELGDAAAGTFTGATMHTPIEVTEQAMSHVRSMRADSLVSVGGGSTTGLGKAIASRTGLPHLVLPTTYAGSEVTALLGETADGEKVTRTGEEIRPDTVIYDVQLTTTLPWAITLTSAVNAMAHSVEALYSADRTAATDAMAADSIAALASGLRVLRADAGSLDARADLLYGAWLAGTCLGTVGMGLHHKLCHTLGGSFGLPHAPTHTVVLPYVMDYNEPAAPAAMAVAATALGVDEAPSGLQAFVATLGGPTSLAELGFTLADVPRAVALSIGRPYPNPREVTRQGVDDLLTRATNGTTIGAAR